MTEFEKFNKAINIQLQLMYTQGELFVVDLEKDELWNAYLSSFNEGDNPIYKERTEHDCNCCKQFIRDVGGVVAILDGELMTVWDVDVGGIYQPVADALHALMQEAPIKNVYRHYQKKVGTPHNHQQTEDGNIIKWDHFNTVLKPKYVGGGNESIAQTLGNFKTNYDLFKRSVEEITKDSIDVVSDLIDQNSIYRGQEFKSIVRSLKSYKTAYERLTNSREAKLWLWKTSAKLGTSGRYKNTVIGTLLHDLSTGVALEDAVKMFESKVAPENYKRTSALITQGMIDQAQKDVEKLGIEDSLYRRYAVENDLTINNVLFADRSTQSKMKGALDVLSDEVAKPDIKSLRKVEDIGINDFINNVLPKVDSIEAFVSNKHVPNFVSLVAPVHEDCPNILKWDNNFSWSYAGEVTDSIKERVKSAGGNVDGDVRASLSWSNYDDLDLHVIEPDGNEIYYANSKSRKSGGQLDVDMNAGGRTSRTPVENIFWKNERDMLEGNYRVFVVQFSKREKSDVGFELQFAHNGTTETFYYPNDVKRSVDVVEFTYTKRDGIKITKRHCDSEQKSKDVWGVNTQQFQKVKMVMNSPNHWDDQEVGNKHWFFMLEDCLNPDKARGFYNEFLRNDLTKHRKVFEVLSSKMKTQESDNQLSGLGFSSTKRNELLVKVRGSFNRTLNIKF